MTLMEERAAALKAAQEIADGAAAAGRELSGEEAERIEELVSQIKGIDARVKDAERGDAVLRSLSALGEAAETPTEPARKGRPAGSLGEHFMGSLKASGRSLRDPGTFRAGGFKAASDVHKVGSNEGAFGPLVTDLDRSPVLPYQRPLVVADLFASGTVTGNAITYPVFGTLEGGAGWVAEGGAKPQAHVSDPKWRTDTLAEIAGFFKVTDSMLDDVEYLVSEINQTLIYDLALKEETALLYGVGASSNDIQGLTNRSGIQVVAQGSDSAQDAIFKALTGVQQATGFAADAIVINPADYTALRLSKDANGQYFGGGFFSGAYGNGGLATEPSLWGRTTVVTASIKAGEVLVGAFKAGGMVFRKGGVVVESTNSHAEDFTNDLVTIRAKERLGLQVKYPAAFAKVTLGGGS